MRPGIIEGMGKEDLRETALNNTFIFSDKSSNKLITKNLIPWMDVKNENSLRISNQVYRIWDPFHSKLAAMILKGSSLSIKKDSCILYLGAANGTTVSHISDIVPHGCVFAVEISMRAMKDLLEVSNHRRNLIPIFADARNPESYRNMFTNVDFVYQDIAQRDQAVIAIRNAQMYLKKNGLLILMIKAKSIDSIKKSDDIINSEIRKINDIFTVIERISLEPFHKNHVAVVAQKTF